MNNWLRTLSNAGLTGYAIFDIPLLFLAAILYPFIESARWLTKQAYFTNWEGYIFRLPAGIVLSVAGAIYSSYYVGWAHSASTWLWLVSGFGGWLATGFYLWPAICVTWLMVVKPWVWDTVQKAVKKFSGPLFIGFVNILGKVLPGSAKAWTKVNEKDATSSRASNLIGALAVLGTAVFAWQVAAASYACLMATSVGTLGLLGWMTGIGAWLMVFALICGLAWEIFSFGKLESMASAFAAGTCIAFAPELAKLASAFGLTGSLAYLVTAAVFTLIVAYVFPLVYLLISGGFIKWVFDQLKPLNERAYNDKDENYKLFFSHVINFAVTGGIGYVAYLISLSLGLSLPVTAAIVALAALLTYLEAYDEFGRYAYVGILAFLSSCVVGWCSYSVYLGAHFAGGSWAGVPAALVAALMWAGIVFPILYLALRVVLYYPGIALAKPLDSLHKGTYSVYRRVRTELLKAYESSYGDRTGYQVWFVHVANIALTVSAYFGSQLLAAQMGLGLITSVAFVALAVYVTYNLAGQLLVSWRGGVSFIGFVASAAATLWVGAQLQAHAYSWLVTILTALTVGSFVGSFAFPIVYIIFRLVARPLLASWSTGILVKIHEVSWRTFEIFWDAFVATYRWLVKIMKPVWKVFTVGLLWVAQAYQAIANIFRRRS